jgi:ABC-type transport system involved in multi-copper enzyme maturation permease subunit
MRLMTLIQKEVLENIVSYRFPLFLLICLVLIPSGMYVNYLSYNKQVQDYHEQSRLAAEAVSSLNMRDLMAGTVAIKGFRRPALLSVFTQGFESALPRFYEFNQDGYKPGESSSGDESILAVQGKVDFIFLVQMVISLIALLFASDLISGEKESGTLRAMLANRLPRDSILIGKITGGYLAVWIPFILTFLVGLLLLQLGSFPFFTGDTPTRLLLVLLFTSLFILIYFTIGIMVSTCSAKARTSLVAILLIWACFQLIVPKVSDMVASVVYPVRTETAVSLEKSIVAKSIDTETARELGRTYDHIFGPGQQANADDTTSPERKRWDSAKEDIEQRAREQKARQLAAIDETYQQEKARRQAAAVNLSLVSPSAAFARLITDICGTGEMERAKYLQAVRSQQQALDQAVFSKFKRTLMIRPSGGTTLGFSVQSVDFNKLPQFSIPSVSPGDVLRENWKSLLSLAFWLIVPFAVAYVRFLKYDVR